MDWGNRNQGDDPIAHGSSTMLLVPRAALREAYLRLAFEGQKVSLHATALQVRLAFAVPLGNPNMLRVRLVHGPSRQALPSIDQPATGDDELGCDSP